MSLLVIGVHGVVVVWFVLVVVDEACVVDDFTLGFLNLEVQAKPFSMQISSYCDVSMVVVDVGGDDCGGCGCV